jgi:hypothetical protein
MEYFHSCFGDDPSLFEIPKMGYIFPSFLIEPSIVLIVFRSKVIFFRKRKQAYIRDCYYRIILELLLCMRDEDETISYNFIVLGNPGIGKSVLCFLFIRVLLELAVNVCTVFIITSFFLFEKRIEFLCEKTARIIFTRKNNEYLVEAFIDGERHRTECRRVWQPAHEFIPRNLRKELLRLCTDREEWIVADEFAFFFG